MMYKHAMDECPVIVSVKLNFKLYFVVSYFDDFFLYILNSVKLKYRPNISVIQ